MSIEAMQWAFNQDVGHSSAKFVLVALGDYAQANGEAWPSIAALAQKTGQDRKTVIANLNRLEGEGYLIDTGKRVGNTGQIKVYRFNFKRQENTENVDGNNAESGTVPKTEQFQNSAETVPFFPPKSTVFPHKSTENGTRNPQEPLKETKGNPQRKARPEPDDFDPLDYLLANGVSRQIAKDWLAVRKHKKSAPTKTAFDGVFREIGKAGYSLEDGIRLCCEKGWAGFNPAWLENAKTTTKTGSALGKAGQATAAAAQRFLENSDAGQ